MEKRKLGHSGIEVSKICLGTMTFGEQNSEKEAHEQCDFAVESGVNFIDTAEMYPVPPKAETCHRTEEFLGTWKGFHQKRDKIIMATKVVGPGFEWIRGGPLLTRKHLTEALEGSLKRLRTDYVDLYQVHWPDRQTNYFGMRAFHQPQNEMPSAISETLETLNDFIKQGKIRTYGLSNETPWGVHRWLELAKETGAARPVSIQNPYSFLNRQYEIGLAEFSHREGIGLLPYSPLAFGMLTGKYDKGAKPKDGRLVLFDRFTRYLAPNSVKAAEKYNQLARDYGFTPAQLALNFVTSRPFVTSTIIGATSMEQLKENLSSTMIELPLEMYDKIEQIYQELPDPAP